MMNQTAELTMDELDDVNGGCPACVAAAVAATLAALAMRASLNDAQNRALQDAGGSFKGVAGG
jgi:Spy/CpxP family protein refolding chaperone